MGRGSRTGIPTRENTVERNEVRTEWVPWMCSGCELYGSVVKETPRGEEVAVTKSERLKAGGD